MALTLTHFLIVCPLCFVAGFVDAVAGGGGLISVTAYMLAGLPTHFAVATNKLSAGMATTLSTIRYAKFGYIDLKLGLLCAAVSLVGSTLGAKLALVVSDYYFKIIILFILPIVAYNTFRGSSWLTEKEPYSEGKTALLAVPFAFFLGMYDGFYGPGAGVFLLIGLTAIAHLPITKANGINKAINCAACYASLAVYLKSGNVLIPLGLTAGCFGLVGSYLGTGAFGKNGVKAAKPVILIVVVIFFVKTLFELFG